MNIQKTALYGLSVTLVALCVTASVQADVCVYPAFGTAMVMNKLLNGSADTVPACEDMGGGAYSLTMAGFLSTESGAPMDRGSNKVTVEEGLSQEHCTRFRTYLQWLQFDPGESMIIITDTTSGTPATELGKYFRTNGSCRDKLKSNHTHADLKRYKADGPTASKTITRLAQFFPDLQGSRQPDAVGKATSKPVKKKKAAGTH